MGRVLSRAECRARHGARLAAEVAERRPDLFDRFLLRLESRGQLAEQAELEGSFDGGTRDLEQYVLPVLVARRDWSRFLRFALVAVNLRELVETLRSPRLLAALAPRRFALATNLAGRLSDPGRRAVARATIAAALRDRPNGRAGDRGRTLDLLKGDLEGAVAGLDPESLVSWCENLCQVARQVAGDLRARWPELLGTLENRPELAGRVRLALAERWLDDEHPQEAWRELARVRDEEPRTGFIVANAQRLAGDDPAQAVERVLGLLPATRPSRWRCAVALVAAGLASMGPDGGAQRRRAARRWWEILRRRLGKADWSVALVEAGERLWRMLDAATLEELVVTIDDPPALAALRIAVARNGGAEARAACDEALEALDADEAWLHWSLRRLTVCCDEPASERSERLRRLAALLADRRFAMPTGDAVGFLDLAAELWPGELGLWVEDLLWSPNSDAHTLLALAGRARHPKLLADLLQRAERHASAVADGEAEGFELRRRVVALAASRLSVLRGDLTPLDEAAPRLLRAEEDSVRAEVAEALVAAGRTDLALAACNGIGSSPLRRRSLVNLLADGDGEDDALRPDRLYELVAGTDWFDDELASLEVLITAPLLPSRLAEERLQGVRGHGRRIQALVDLAWHAIRFEEERGVPVAQRDPLAAQLPLRQALGVVESEDWLVNLIPELVELGATLGPQHALAELKQGYERTLARETVDWEVREQALDRILWQGSRALLAAGRGRVVNAMVAEWLRWLLDLPRLLDASAPGGHEVRCHWLRLLPCIVAGAESLPETVRRRVGRGHRGPRRHMGGGTVSSRVASNRRSWPELGEGAEPVISCCAATPEQRAQRAREAVLGEVEAEALAWLLAGPDPAAARSAARRIADPVRRDRLCARVARFAAGDEAERRRWIGGIDDDRRARLARLASDPPDGLEPVVRAGDLAEDDPRFEPVRRAAWKIGGDEAALQHLAGAVVAALRVGGERAGRSGMRVWLNAAIAPRLGRPGSDSGHDRLLTFLRAARQAHSIGGTADAGAVETAGRGRSASPASDAEATGPPPAGGDAITASSEPSPTVPERSWSRAWSRRPQMWKRGVSRIVPAWGLLAITGVFALAGIDLAMIDLLARLLAAAPGEVHAPPAWTVASLAATTVLNGVLLGSYTRWRTSGSTPRSWPRRGLDLVLLSTPWIGPFVAVAQLERAGMGETKDLAGFGSMRTFGRAVTPGAARRWAWVGTAYGGSAVVLLNFGVTMIALPRVFAAVDGRPVGAMALVAFGLAAHAAAYLAARNGFGGLLGEEAPRESWSRIRSLFLFTWALPVPMLPLVFLLLVVLAGPLLPVPGGGLAARLRRVPIGGNRPGETAGAVNGSPAFRQGASGDESRAVSRLALGCQLAMVACGVDGLVTGCLLAATVPQWRPAGQALALVALGIGGGGLVAMVVGGLRRLRARQGLSSLPTGASSVAGTALPFFVGYYAGDALAAGEVAEAVAAIVVSAAAAAVIELIALMAGIFGSAPDGPRLRSAFSFVRILVYCWLGLMLHPATPRDFWLPDRSLAVLAVAGMATLHLAAFLVVAPVLLLPATRRDLSRRELPWREQARLWLLVLTAALPLGGFAMPWWLRHEAGREGRAVAAWSAAGEAYSSSSRPSR